MLNKFQEEKKINNKNGSGSMSHVFHLCYLLLEGLSHQHTSSSANCQWNTKREKKAEDSQEDKSPRTQASHSSNTDAKSGPGHVPSLWHISKLAIRKHNEQKI
jgi:hypothetical protein